jgi:hypothetical protein
MFISLGVPFDLNNLTKGFCESSLFMGLSVLCPYDVCFTPAYELPLLRSPLDSV